MFIKRSFYQNKTIQRLGILAVVIIVAAIGTYLLAGTHATTPYTSITADRGTLANGATSQSCAGASDGNCVTFGGASGAPSILIGVGGSGGQGASVAQTFTNAGIRWDRIEYVMPNTSPRFQTPTQDAGYGISTIAEINTDDNTPIASLDQNAYATYGLSLIRANPNVKLWEVLNEAYYKGGRADPQAYGKLYLALYNAVKNDGVTGVTLLFNMYGDYFNTTTGQWSQDCCNNGGWLRDAVAANPGLATALASEAFSSHPYGGVNVNNQDESGTGAIAGHGTDNLGSSQEKVAQTTLGTIPPFYLTEFGYSLADLTSGKYTTPCGSSNPQGGQAYLLTAAYNIFLTDPHIKGIWWYDAHDSNFGILNPDFSPRPALAALTNELDLQPHTPSCNP